ncbi:hypothetical protein BDP27DRAFT_1054730 [Rhodocollybia butyracea]|uniref:Uncharacterized protein n=1 Tax=Rhodocollybia butyracea TaxID=206335 RepID=A0A9P5PMH9_9AGAR|nr:hypothetical protein BDP27DRAFT_1054730 [Rhodocollybia butyracea]
MSQVPSSIQRILSQLDAWRNSLVFQRTTVLRNLFPGFGISHPRYVIADSVLSSHKKPEVNIAKCFLRVLMILINTVVYESTMQKTVYTAVSYIIELYQKTGQTMNAFLDSCR